MKGACKWCRYFRDDAETFERTFPCLIALSSAKGASRGDQGLCLLHECMVTPACRCDAFLDRMSSVEWDFQQG